LSKKIRVGIIGRDLRKKGGGTKTYISNILKTINNNKSENLEFYLIHNSLGHKNQFVNFKETFVKGKNKLIFDYLHVPIWSRNNKLDIVLFPKNTIPFFVRGRKILVIHDLAYFIPEISAYTLLDRIYTKRMIKSSFKRADKIIAVSGNTKRDITNIFGVDEEKVDVIYHGVDEKYRVIEDNKKLDVIKKKYNLKDKFILFTGGITPRKNLARLIKIFNDISDKIEHDLVLTGGKGWNNKRELELIKKNNRIKRLGFVPDEEMPFLYNLADFYIYPSLYEGFGLPILEAQACGCSVITSNISSIPEVGGDSVFYFDPNKENEITSAILEISRNEKLKKKLIIEGFKNVKKFNWNKATRKLLKLIKEV